MRRAKAALLAVLLCLTLSACTHDADYSAYAGTYALASVESAELTYTDFDYAVIVLGEKGGYTLEYKHKGTTGTMTGKFSAQDQTLRFSGDVAGTATYNPGYFTLTFLWGGAETIMVFAQT